MFLAPAGWMDWLHMIWLGRNGFMPQGRLPVPIYAIQGTGHISPLDGQFVTTEGIVTARNDDGFYIQAAAADTDEATSEAIFVAAGQPISVTVGDSVRVAAHVAEAQANGSSGNGLPVTHLVNPAVTIVSNGNPLPAPTILGTGGRALPTGVIEDDGLSLFDPQDDGLDFFESLEAMRVQVNDALVVGATDANGATWVLADGGADASQRSTRVAASWKQLAMQIPSVFGWGVLCTLSRATCQHWT